MNSICGCMRSIFQVFHRVNIQPHSVAARMSSNVLLEAAVPYNCMIQERLTSIQKTRGEVTGVWELLCSFKERKTDERELRLN